MALVYSPDNHPPQPADTPFVLEDNLLHDSKDAFGPLDSLFEPLSMPDRDDFVLEPESSFFDMNLLPTVDDVLPVSTNDALVKGEVLSECAGPDVNENTVMMDGLDYATVFSPWFGSPVMGNGREETTTPAMGSSPLRRGTDPMLYQPVVGGDGLGLGLQASPRVAPSMTLATFPTSPPLTPSTTKRDGRGKEQTTPKEKSLRWKNSLTATVRSNKRKSVSGVSKVTKGSGGRHPSTPPMVTTPTKQKMVAAGGSGALELPMNGLPLSPPPSGRALSDGFPTTFRMPSINTDHHHHHHHHHRQLSLSPSTAAMSPPNVAGFMSPDMMMDASMMSRGGSYQGSGTASFGQSPTMETGAWSFEGHQQQRQQRMDHMRFSPGMEPTSSMDDSSALSSLDQGWWDTNVLSGRFAPRHSLPSERMRARQVAQRVISMTNGSNNHHHHRRCLSHHPSSSHDVTNGGDLAGSLAMSGLMISASSNTGSDHDRGYLLPPMTSSSVDGSFPMLPSTLNASTTTTTDNMRMMDMDMDMSYYPATIDNTTASKNHYGDEKEECYSPKGSPRSPSSHSVILPKQRAAQSSRDSAATIGHHHHRQHHASLSSSSSSSSPSSSSGPSPSTGGIRKPQRTTGCTRAIISPRNCAASKINPMDYTTGLFSSERSKSMSSSSSTPIASHLSSFHRHHRHRQSTATAPTTKDNITATNGTKQNKNDKNANNKNRKRKTPHIGPSQGLLNNDDTNNPNEEQEQENNNNKINFVNFTPSDHHQLLTGVAPSGSSKTKARRDHEAAERRRKLNVAALKAVEAAGGDVDVLRSEVGGMSL